MEYRYAHYDRGRLRDDLAFHGGPRPGEPFPDFDLPTTDGRHLKLAEVIGKRPLLLVLGSTTCPATAASLPVLADLYQGFGDRVAFATVYTRESHPGERYPQPRSFQQKMTHALDFKERRAIPWTVAVDTLDGRLHRALDYKSNGTWLIDRDGVVAFRTLGASDRRGLVRALRRVATGKETRLERHARVAIGLSALGMLWPVIHDAGAAAERDLRRAGFPVWWLGRLAREFRRLPPFGRGLAAVGLVTGTALAGALILRRAWRV